MFRSNNTGRTFTGLVPQDLQVRSGDVVGHIFGRNDYRACRNQTNGEDTRQPHRAGAMKNTMDLIEHRIGHFLSAYMNNNENLIGHLFKKEHYEELLERMKRIQNEQESDTHHECIGLAFKSIGVAQKAYLDRLDLTQQIDAPQEPTLCPQLNQDNSHMANISISTKQVTYDMDLFVVQYIMRYGMPIKGIFDAEKYANLKEELDSIPISEWDWTIRHCSPEEIETTNLHRHSTGRV